METGKVKPSTTIISLTDITLYSAMTASMGIFSRQNYAMAASTAAKVVASSWKNCLMSFVKTSLIQPASFVQTADSHRRSYMMSLRKSTANMQYA